MKAYKIIFVIAFVFTLKIFPQASGSIGIADARSAAMGKTSVTSSFGLRAIGSNPANLFSDSLKHVEFVISFPLPNLSGSVGTNFMTIDEYNYFFGTKTKDAEGKNVGRYLTDADKSRLKNLFADGGAVTSDIQLQYFAISIKPSNAFGTISFSMGDVFSSNVTIPKGLVSIALDGNPVNQLYNFNDTKLKAWWLRKYSLSYARSINILPVFQKISVGVSFNIIQGFAYVGTEHVNTQLTTGAGNIITGKGDFLAYAAFSPDFNVKYDFDKSTTVKKDFNFTPFPTPAGNGLGLDFGLNAKLNDVWSFGFSITDIGSVKWNKNAAQYSSNSPIYLDDLSSQSQRDSLVKALVGKDNGKYISEFTTQLATALHLGASMQLNNLLLAFDYNQGFNDQPRNSKKPRVSVGADWVLGFFALRTGLSFGGFDKFNWGLGCGFDFGFLEMNFGTPDFESVVVPNSAKRVTVAIDSRWKF
ncbi:MAG: DUF5723 family protein [Ignavibacteriales bacterium]|nr:DUF5723 family protein [Ignavibacteriales bacterium]